MKTAVCAALLALLSSCCSRGSCIKPPPMSSEEQNTVAANIAAQLAGAPAGGSLSVSYSNILKETYDKLSDNDKALYLFLVAIDCYLEDGKVGQEIAKQMAQAVQAKWAAKQPLTARSTKLEQRVPELAPRIRSIQKRLGIE